MKKLSLLIALALCVTIGGVYATWDYGQQSAVNEEPLNYSLSLEHYSADGAKGSIETVENTLKITVDDIDAVDYVAELVYNGRIVIVFAPYSQADQAIKDNGINVEYEITSTLMYQGSSMFDLPAGATQVAMTKIESADQVAGVDLSTHIGDFVGVVTPADLKATGFDLADITLPDLDAYHAFQDALTVGTVTINFQEKLS